MNRLAMVAALYLGISVFLYAQDEGMDAPRVEAPNFQSFNAGEAITWVDFSASAKKLGYDITIVEQLPTGKTVVRLERSGKTDKTHGVLGLNWAQRDTLLIELYEVEPGRHKVISTTEKVETKAPWGGWNEAKDIKAVLPVSFASGEIEGKIKGTLPGQGAFTPAIQQN